MELLKIIKEEISKFDDITRLPFVKDVYNQNGKIYYVGGYVRDSYLNKLSKDIDILVTGIPMDNLEMILGKSGKVDSVGKSFGVLKFIPSGTEMDLDVAIPRVEKSTGDKYTDFEVVYDHNLPIEKDLFRRDFSINAIAKDIEGNVIDPFGGIDDIKNKIIRMVNPDAFSDDPLRLLRAINFATRFNFTIEPKTYNLIKKNAYKIKSITSERILIEFDKMVKKGDPELGIKLLVETELFENIFGVKRRNVGGIIDSGNIKTMGEFIFTLLYGFKDISEIYKKKLKGDISTTKEIMALETLFNNQSSEMTESLITMFKAYSIYSNIVNSNILTNWMLKVLNEFNKLPKTIKEIDINGNELMNLGYSGIGVSQAYTKILNAIYSYKIKNSKQEIIKFISND